MVHLMPHRIIQWPALRLNNRLWIGIAIVVNLLVLVYYRHLSLHFSAQNRGLCSRKKQAEDLPPYLHGSMIQKIRKLIHPPFHDEEYVLKNPNLLDYSQKGHTTILMKHVFKYKKFGVFFEAGALDGEKYSNTLMLERNYSWTGLLVEPDPRNYKNLLKRKRKSLMLPACVGTHLWKAQSMVFRTYKFFSWGGRLIDIGIVPRVPPGEYTDYQMVCYPLPAMLKAANINHLDLLILDLEGSETYVLATFPWGDFRIDVVVVECNLCLDHQGNLVTDDIERVTKRYFLKFLMESNGFREVGYVNRSDIIYAHESMQVENF